MSQWNIIFIVSMCSIAGIHHLLRIIYLLFKPKVLSRFGFITNRNLTTSKLLLYYIITVAFSTMVILNVVSQWQ